MEILSFTNIRKMESQSPSGLQILIRKVKDLSSLKKAIWLFTRVIMKFAGQLNLKGKMLNL